MASNFWHQVNAVIAQADILMEIVDARMIDETRNMEIEQKILARGKRFLMVINKCELADIHLLKKKKTALRKEGIDCVFVSAKLKLGKTILLNKLAQMTAHKTEGKVGILGYPNVGKSSLINSLTGRAAAPTSAVSNYTRSLRNVRLNEKLMLIDTPGVFPDQEIPEYKKALIGARSSQQIKDPEGAAMKILDIFIEAEPRQLREHYGVDVEDGIDSSDLLDAIAIARKKLIKGGQPDLNAISKIIIDDWQSGRLLLKGSMPTEELNEE